MSPEFYAIIGVGVSTLGFLSGLTAVMFYLFSQVSRRMDRLEMRMDRLEDKFDRLQEQIISLERQLLALEKRVSRLEWMFEAQFGRRVLPPDAEEGQSEGA
jgi:hypothetical protein